MFRLKVLPNRISVRNNEHTVGCVMHVSLYWNTTLNLQLQARKWERYESMSNTQKIDSLLL